MKCYDKLIIGSNSKIDGIDIVSEDSGVSGNHSGTDYDNDGMNKSSICRFVPVNLEITAYCTDNYSFLYIVIVKFLLNVFSLFLFW